MKDLKRAFEIALCKISVAIMIQSYLKLKKEMR